MPRALAAIALGIFCSACPSSRIYRPDSSQLREMDAGAERHVFPEDVRRDLAAHSNQLVLWTGIVRSKTPVSISGRDAVEIRIDHHYWDFVEDFGVQRARAFLSPRGEGAFIIRVWADQLRSDPGNFQEGWMALIWGTPAGVAPDGAVRVNLRGSTCAPPGWFSTEMWDYGRAYLLQHDYSDLHILRTF